MKHRNLPKQPVRVARRKTHVPPSSLQARAYQIARRVRAELPRFARQADVAKELGVTRGRLEQLEIEILAKVVLRMLQYADDGSVFPEF